MDILDKDVDDFNRTVASLCMSAIKEGATRLHMAMYGEELKHWAQCDGVRVCPITLSSFAMLGILYANPATRTFIKDYESLAETIEADHLPYITYMKCMAEKVLEMDAEIQACESEAVNPNDDGPLH